MPTHMTRNFLAVARTRWWLAFLLAIWFSTLHAQFLQAQTPTVRFEHLALEDGLSHSAVHAIAQDHHGFLWFGTREGLNRYDGERFRVFLLDETLGASAENFVTDLLVDRQGVLWVSSSGGLGRFDHSTERFTLYRHIPQDSASLATNELTELLEDHIGSLWVASKEGLHRLQPDGTFVRYQPDPDDEHSLSARRVEALAEDRQGRLWVGTYGGGLDLFDRQTETFRHFRHDPADPRSLGDNIVNAIQEDADGDLWVGTARGLNYFDRKTEAFTRFHRGEVDLSEVRIFQLLLDREEELWVGTQNAGLIRIPPGGPPTQYRHDGADPWSLSGDRIFSLFEDRSGILWSGSYVGLNKYNRRHEQFTIYRREPGHEQTLSDSNVSAILEDRSGMLWIGTWDKGLNRLDRQRGEVIQFRPEAGNPRSLPDETIQALCEDRTGALWVATWGGLARLDPAREAFTVYRPDPQNPASLESDAVKAVYEDHRGQIWVGTIFGSSRFEPRSEGFIPYPLGDGSEANVEVFLEDRSGTLWVGTQNTGLFYLDPTAGPGEAGHFQHDPANSNTLGSQAINTLHEDREGRLWIGTNGDGLDRLDPAREHFIHYREEDGLAHNVVLGILEEEGGRLWLSTSRGLSRFDPRTESFQDFSVEDGLQDNRFSHHSAFRSPRGEMFFGGPRGLNVFFPQQIHTDTYVPPVVLTDFQLFNESVPMAWRDPESPLERSILETEEIHLSHRDSVFSLEFAALHYANPRKNRYTYRLEGFDESWTTTDGSRRRVTYTNLDAGTYRFRVRGSSANGVWNERQATVRIVVAPPPWKSWWAYTLYALAGAAAVLTFVLSHSRELRRERLATERERLVNQRLREVDRLKDDFLANTSHELRTPLYGITGLAESLLDGAAGELSEAVQRNLTMIVASGHRLGHLVNDILDFSKLRHQSLELRLRPVDLHTLADVVLTLSEPLAKDKNLRLENRVPPDLAAAEADENRLQQILYNLIGNAIKFTEEGAVEVAAEAVDERLVVRVVDTGIGMRPEQQKHIFDAFEQADASVEREYGGTGLGLAVTRQLVELHGGEIWVESRPGEGSTFSFSLPLAREPAESSTPGVVESHTVAEPALATSAMGQEAAVPGEVRTFGDDVVRILAVDDEPVNRQVLTNYLTLEHFELITAAGGEEALQIIEEQHFDLVLLDVMMPKVSGYEVCRALRKKYPKEDLPVLFLTAKNQADDVVAGLSLGANDFLTKPVSKRELLARLRPHLDLLAVHRNLEGLVKEKISEIQVLEGLLPICSSCKKICSEDGEWEEIETFIAHHSEAEFSHGLCPDCAERLYAGFYQKKS